MRSKIEKISRVMAHVILVIIIAFPVLSIITWLDMDLFTALVSQELGEEFNLSAMSMPGRIAGFFVSLFGAGLQVVGFIALRNTFQEAGNGRPLSLKSIMNFRRFAFISLAMVFVGILQHTAYILIFSMSDPEIPRQLAITVGSSEVYALFVGILFLFVSTVFASGRMAQEENASFL
ncbi:MAG: hypothetical protein V7750_06435 [Sneathiella sp.]